MPADDLLDRLDPEQRAAVLAVRGPVCILAGAGTGKTRTITTRIAYAAGTGAVSPDAVLALTFTTRAAGEMRSRLRLLGVPDVQARTFHSAALRQLAHFWPRVVGEPLPELVESKLRGIALAAARRRLTLSRPELRDVASEVEWAKATLVDPEGYAAAAADAGRRPPLPVSDVALLFAAYEQVRRDQGVLDFEDLLLLTAGLLEEHPEVAGEVRRRYRHFVVDEYQDVSPLQHRLLDAWLGDRDDLCVVGDPNQTIYSFGGASPAFLLGFGRRFPTASVVRLVRDYRSTPQVVALANRVGAGPGRLELLAQRPSGPDPVLTEYADEPAEAAAAARRCARLLADGVPAHEIAVLFRVNAQSEVYERALADEGVPYQLRGGERFFDRPEVREAMLLLRGAARAGDQDRPAELVPAVAEVLASAGFRPGAQPAGAGAARDRWESLAALFRLAEQFAAERPEAGLLDLVAELGHRADAQHAPDVAGVTLATLHAAKGLEWDAVFLVGIVDGTVPITYAVTEEQVAEERRLLYVGITRAREHLWLSWAQARSPGGRRSRRASRFLDGVRAPRPSGRRGGRGGAPRQPAGGEGVDPELFERLRAWRLEQARSQSQPAFCVFTDATLAAIARTRPGSVAELAAIGGVGSRKLSSYGEAVLDLVAGGSREADT